MAQPLSVETKKQKIKEKVRQRSRQVVLSASKVQMTVMALPHPLDGRKSGCNQFERFYVSSLQSLFERLVDNGFCHSYQAIRSDQVCSHNKRS